MDQYRQLIPLSQNYQYLFTVFTPVYNRAHTLSRVYNSLKSQIYRDFEWLIVDDGSTDNTCKLVEQWQKDAEFPISYFWQENQGKHVAFNRGVQQAKGELFLTFDSDDACLPEALERFKHHWYSLPGNVKDKFSGVTALCMNQYGNIVGNEFPCNVFDSDAIEIHTKYKVFGEKWGFHKTEVLKEFPFPEIQGENFITESIVWNRISLKYKTRFVNEVLRIYYENMTDSLTTSLVKIRAKNPIGAKLYYQEYVSLSGSIMWKLRSIINYIRFSFHANNSHIQILQCSEYKILTTMLLMVGYFFYKRDVYSFKSE